MFIFVRPNTKIQFSHHKRKYLLINLIFNYIIIIFYLFQK